MEKFIPYEKLSKKGSDTTAAGGGFREWSEWQRSARCKSASPDAASAGHRNRDQRKMDLARRQTWGELNPVTGQPENSKTYNRNKPIFLRQWALFTEMIPGSSRNEPISKAMVHVLRGSAGIFMENIMPGIGE